MRDSGYLMQIVHAGMLSAGLDAQALWQRLGFNLEQSSQREIRTPHHNQAPFWAALEDISGDPEIGLHLCPHLPTFRGEVIEYLFFSSPVLREGCMRASRYLRLVSDAMVMHLHEEGGQAWLGLRATANDAPTLRHTEICVVYAVVQFLSGMTSGQFKPLRIRLCCTPRAPAAEYAAIFGCEVTFGGNENEIFFDPALLDYRSPHGDPELLRLHVGFAEQRLSRLRRADLIERVRAVLAQRLEVQRCELEDIAAELNMPARRLRAELAAAGTSFKQVLAGFRYALARRLLAGTDEPIERIVYLTGFSEPSTFYRAFKRWAGMTPVQYRERQRQEARTGTPDADTRLSTSTPA